MNVLGEKLDVIILKAWQLEGEGEGTREFWETGLGDKRKVLKS